MKVTRFDKMYINEINDYKDYDYNSDDQIFVLARYERGWDNYYNNTPFKNDQFVPCMITNNKLFITGQISNMPIDYFEIIPSSDEKIQEIIDVYLTSNKYNL